MMPPSPLLPSCDQAEPFQRATLPTATPPAELKLPPTTRSPFGSTASANTVVCWGVPLATPVPNADQALPFQRATWFTSTPPAVLKWPPAIRSPFGSTQKAYTSESTPAPSGAQALPFQRATLCTITPPAR